MYIYRDYEGTICAYQILIYFLVKNYWHVSYITVNYLTFFFRFFVVKFISLHKNKNESLTAFKDFVRDSVC